MSDARFRGQILGIGSSSGVRVVVGRWLQSPLGSFADAMVARPDGSRVLLAPRADVADFIASTYSFDEVRVEPFVLQEHAAGSGRRREWQVEADSLRLQVQVGSRAPLGHLLRLVPPSLASRPGFTLLSDPIARVVMRGVRTRGTAQAGRREFYGATDLHRVLAIRGDFEDAPLGALAPVDPPPEFGFSSTPRRPGLTSVVTTVRDLDGR